MSTVLQPLDPGDSLMFDRRSVLPGMWAAAVSAAAVAVPGAAWGMSSSTLVSQIFGTPRHTTHYLESGPADGR